MKRGSGEDFAYDITDEEACWELLRRPITVLDAGQREEIYPRVTPGGEKVNDDKLGGFINGASAAVHVLGEDEDGWTLIEGLDYYNRVIRGYVKTSLLKTVTPNDKYGVIIDKLHPAALCLYRRKALVQLLGVHGPAQR